MSDKAFNRRKFIRLAGLAGGTAAVPTLLAACSDSGVTPTVGSGGSPGSTPGFTAQSGGPGPGPTVPPLPTVGTGPVDSYVALAPAIFRAGQTEKISVTLFGGAMLAGGTVKAELIKNNQAVASVEGTITGRGDLALKLPQLAEDVYILQLSGTSFQAQSQVKVVAAGLLFVESDKPVYKPGQSIQLRVLRLNPDLRPEADSVTVEVLDAGGTKVFKKTLQTDQFGMASLSMPLSAEPNLGA